MARTKKKKQSAWQRMKKRAPRVPDITCPDIDSIITRLERHVNTRANYTQFRHRQIVKIMERLRKANESLRDSGEYWYDIAKQHLSDQDR